MSINVEKLPRWIFAFAALALTFVAIFGMFFSECRTHIFGVQFGKDRACSVADAEVIREMKRIEARIDGIRLKVVATSRSVAQDCPFDQAADDDNLVVMYGSRDGTSCRVTNQNYYKEIGLEIPK